MTEIPYATWPILAALQLLPLAGAAVVFALGERTGVVVLGRIIALLELALGFVLYRHIDPGSNALQLAERADDGK